MYIQIYYHKTSHYFNNQKLPNSILLLLIFNSSSVYNMLITNFTFSPILLLFKTLYFIQILYPVLFIVIIVISFICKLNENM